MKSKHTIKNHARFKGDFKKDVKGEIDGRDLAEFIAEQLRQKNHVVRSVENDEIWFTVNVTSGSIEYPLMVCRSIENDDYWEISCPRTLGFFARLLGKSENTELQNLIDALDGILQGEKTVTDIKWYSDYLELSDDYIQKPGEKRLSVVGKYLQKLFLPLCLTGWVLALIGGILHGKESVLIRVGVIMFLLPIASYFGFIVISGLWGLVDDIKESFQKKKKKKWGRWFVALFFVSLFLAPFLGFFTGLLRNPAIERAMPTIETFMFRAMILIFFGLMVFVFGAQLVRSVSRIFIPRYRKKRRRKEPLFLIGSFLVLVGFTGFLSGFFSAFGLLSWIPGNIKFPLADVKGIDINRDGKLFVASGFYSRIQMYNPQGEFVRGWFLTHIGGGAIKIRINDNNEVEVAGLRGDAVEVFDESGRLLKYKKYDDVDFWDYFVQKGNHLLDKSTGCRYDVEGWVYPKIIQTCPDGKKVICKNAFYLFPLQGPFQAIVTAMVGMYLMGLAEKKKKRSQTIGIRTM